MYSLRFCLFASYSAVCLAVLPAYAQQNPGASHDAPPQLEKLEEGELPAVTSSSGVVSGTISEKRGPGGQRTEVKVSSGRSTYYVQPNDQHGTTQLGDAQSIRTKPAQWEILRFEPRRNKQVQQESAGQAVPPPPALSPTTPAPSPTAK